MTHDQRGSEVIDVEECRHLLEQAGSSGKVGHLAINREGSPPHVIPINFSVYGQMILMRLGPGFAAHHLDGTRVTFEVDDSEPYSKKGWSVVVTGTAHLVTYEEVARLGSNVPEPIVSHPGMRVFSIELESVSGRSIYRNLEGTSPLPSAPWRNGVDQKGRSRHLT